MTVVQARTYTNQGSGKNNGGYMSYRSDMEGDGFNRQGESGGGGGNYKGYGNEMPRLHHRGVTVRTKQLSIVNED